MSSSMRFHGKQNPISRPVSGTRLVTESRLLSEVLR